MIRCSLTEKLYIGQTWNTIHDRIVNHKSSARKRHNVCVKLEHAINKYGENNFTIEKLDEAYSQADANTIEDFYILAGDTIANGYNIKRGGSFGKHSPETIIKMREAKLGSKNYWYRKIPHPNTMLALYKANKNIKKSLTSRQKHSKTLQPLNTDTEKYCPKCKEVKLNNNFYKRKAGTIYTYYILSRYCISCEAQRNKEKYLRSKLPPK